GSAASMRERSPRAAVSRSSAFSAISHSASSVKTSSMLSYPKKRWYWRVSAFFGSVRIWTRSSRRSWCTAETTGRRPMNSGISPKLRRSSGITSARRSLDSTECFDLTSAPKPTAFLPMRRARGFVEAGERAAANEEDVRRVDREELLVGVLPPALRRNGGDRPLEDLQQRLLDALARDVARDRRVVRLARDLVDLVDVDDPGLGLLD